MIMEEESMQDPAPHVSVWCHSCSSFTSGSHYASEELSCNDCGSTFVEESDQGIEEFTNIDEQNFNDVDVSDGNAMGNGEILQQIMNRVMSLREHLNYSEAQDDISPQSNGSSINRIIIRQSPPLSTVAETSLFGNSAMIFSSGNMLIPSNAEQSSDDSPDDGMMLVQPMERERGGILGLLSSLTALRQLSSGSAAEERNHSYQFEQFLHHILMNENSHAGAPPASSDHIEALSRMVVRTEDEISELGECSISQELFQLGDVAVTLPCEHRFKEESIVHWLKMHNTCPVCRVHISSQP